MLRSEIQRKLLISRQKRGVLWATSPLAGDATPIPSSMAYIHTVSSFGFSENLATIIIFPRHVGETNLNQFAGFCCAGCYFADGLFFFFY